MVCGGTNTDRAQMMAGCRVNEPWSRCFVVDGGVGRPWQLCHAVTDGPALRPRSTRFASTVSWACAPHQIIRLLYLVSQRGCHSCQDSHLCRLQL